MRKRWVVKSAAAVTAAAATGLLAAAQPAAGQVGAIGGAPSSAVSGGATAARAPLFSESALVMPRGGWTAGAYGGYTSGGIEGDFTSIDFSFTQLVIGGFFALTERVVLGAAIFPYASVSVDSDFGSEEESGRGDGLLYGKAQFWSSADGRTSIAGIANVGLPIGDDDFGAEGVSFGIGGAVTHTVNQVSLHGSAGFAIPTDDADGETTFNFNAAFVYAAQSVLSLGAELLGSTFSAGGERFTIINAAPGARVRLAERVFLDGGLLFNVSTSPGESPFDYAFLIGATITK
jgi:hypothetical protein